MSSKTVQISARISDEDAEFISQLKIEGAKTPSDKLRTIISETRRRNEDMYDYGGCYKIIQNLTLPLLEKIRHYELDYQLHSELVIRFFEWVPDIIAFAVSAIPDEEGQDTREGLKKYEKELIGRIFRLFGSVLQMGVTAQSPCYDPGIISKEISPILSLANIINETNNREKKK